MDTRVIYRGDNLEQLPKLPDASTQACLDYLRPRCVALAAIQGSNQKLEETRAGSKRQDAKNVELKRVLEESKAAL